MRYPKCIPTLLSWMIGLLFSSIGLINTFWGNDAVFGVFIVLISCIYIPPLSRLFTKITRLVIPFWVKFIAGLFIVWASLGVGELFTKIQLMLQSIQGM